MKIILTEEQYQLIEDILQEVTKPFSYNIEVGGSMDINFTKPSGDKTSQNIMITKVFGGGRYVEVHSKYGKYHFDKATAYDPNENTFTFLKDAIYTPAEFDDKGKQIDTETLTGGSKIPLRGVTKIDIYDSNKSLVDTVLTDSGDEEDDKAGGDAEEELKTKLMIRKKKAAEKEMRAKRVADMVANNPNLQRAMGHRKSFMAGLIDYGSTLGIGPGFDVGDSTKLAKKYIDKLKGDGEKKKAIAKEFTKNTKYTVKNEGKSIKIKNPFANEKQVDFHWGNGKVRAVTSKGNAYFSGSGKGGNFKLFFKEKESGSIYSGTIKVWFRDVNGNVEEEMQKVFVNVIDSGVSF